jgi:NAD dependent epimerase/dehydratase family.
MLMLNKRQKKVVITGAGGFVGRNLSEYLANMYEVCPMGHSDLDLLDAGAVKDFFAANPVDVVLHCAAVGGSRLTGYDAARTDVVENNLRMFLNLERSLPAAAFMIHLGSGAEYDRRHWRKKMPEDYFDEHVPADAYGFVKYAIAKYIGQRENIACFRIFGLFGKYEDYRYKFISNAIVKNLLRLPIVINQDVVFDYLYIDDLCRIVGHFIKNKPKYGYYNITPSESTDLGTLGKLINEVGEYQSPIHILHGGMNREYSGANVRMMAELGNFSFASYREAVRALYGYYQSVLDTLDLRAIEEDSYLMACQRRD